MIVSAWNNSKHHKSGAGYGIRISPSDRDTNFRREWQTVVVEVPSQGGYIDVVVNIAKKTFWDPRCGELISGKIGRWLIEEGYSHWPRGHPPKIELEKKGRRRFVVMGILAS